VDARPVPLRRAFGGTVIALPLVIVSLVALAYAWRRDRFDARAWPARLLQSFQARDLAKWERILWFSLIAWLALRFALLAAEVASRPLYPWDAWTQWATKARVWYELRTIAPFAPRRRVVRGRRQRVLRRVAGVSGDDALLQVFTCIMLGRWDDVLMNAPWWQMAVALAFAVYGGCDCSGLRQRRPSSALPRGVAAARQRSRGARRLRRPPARRVLRRGRDRADALVARARSPAMPRSPFVLAIACTQIKNPGWFWAATLVPRQ
jgi:hypothetical protein